MQDDDLVQDYAMQEDEEEFFGSETCSPRTSTVSPTTIVWTRHPTANLCSSSLVTACRQCTVNNKPVNLNALPEDLLAYMACFLNVGSLKQARLVNRKFNRVLSTDKAGWKAHVQRLAHRRLHVTFPPVVSCAKEAYRMACADARLRHAVRREELVYDWNGQNKGTVWSFRFKQVAGVEWTQYDPWHQGHAARQMVFLANGTVRQLAEDGTMHFPFYDAPRLPGGLEIRWRFVTQPIGLPRKECGAYVRLTIAGRDVPTYMVHRSPSGNWGFLMENCWGLFSSFALPARKTTTVPSIVNQHHATIPRMRLRRDSHGGARWLDVSQEESDDEEEDDMEEQHKDKNYLLEDSSLNVTCRWQWQEALLYNLGASILPDGPNATADFDRAWQLSMRSMASFGFPTATLNQEGELMDDL